MSKLFVTDPCLVVPDEQWGAFNENLNWDFGAELKTPFETSNGLKVVEIMSTANGDGGCKVRGKEFGTDTGTIAIIEVPDDFKPEPKTGAFAGDMEDAESLMAEVCAAL